MIDVDIIRTDPARVKRDVERRHGDPGIVDIFLELDERWRSVTSRLDNLRAKQKEFSAARDIESARKNKEEIRNAEADLSDLSEERRLAWENIPNLLSDDVPDGKDESENKPVRNWGEIPKFDFEPKDHLALGEALDVIDVKRAAKVSGARFGYFKRDAALLEFAILQHGFSVLTDPAVLKKIADTIEPGYPATPFIPVVPPQMIRPDVYRRTARLNPKDQDERYYLPQDDIYLIGSAEHTLGPLHMDETLDEKMLPLRYVGFSTCFRREAGSYGKDTRGILRVHQFDKLEMESFTTPEMSRKEQDFMVAVQEYLMRSLEIPYQVVMICTGDIGDPDTRQVDIESWMPGQGKYRETHTSDLIADYQARRLNIKVKGADGTVRYAHMNDATAFAISRTPIAIMENYQTKEGNIRVPEVLRRYMGKDMITPPEYVV